MSLYKFKIETMDAIAALCRPYVTRMTVLGDGAQDPRDDQVWADIKVEEKFSQNGHNKVSLDVVLRVAVTRQEGAGKYSMYFMDLLRDVIARAKLPVMARIVNQEQADGRSELQAAIVYRVHIWSVEVSDTVQDAIFTGVNTITTATIQRQDETAIGTGSVTFAGPAISWVNAVWQYAAAPQELFWAGLSGGEVIDVVDDAGSVVESITVSSGPTGRATTTASLGTGVYQLVLGSTVSPTKLFVQEPPA